MLVEAIRELQRRLVAEFHTSPDLFDEIARMESLLAETYRDRVLYELLQNSDDARSSTVRIIQRRGLDVVWENDGRPFMAADVESLCRSARSTKARGDDAIGYRGIGFKSLAAIASSIKVESGGAAFTFDRRAAAATVGGALADTMPLIRVPTAIESVEVAGGARFSVAFTPGGAADPQALDPLAGLFLRHVRRIVIDDGGRVSTVETRPGAGGQVTLTRSGHADATFVVRDLGNSAALAVPLDAAALSLTGANGRLSCFLPLADSLGIPCVVSGMVLTDPSRTHAVVGDPATEAVVDAAARAVCAILADPADALFDRIWELCLTAEDPRATLSSTASSVSHRFWSALRQGATAIGLSAQYSPVGFTAAEAEQVVPAGTPRALFLSHNRGAAKALKAVLGLGTADVAQVVDPSTLARLSTETRAAIVEHVRENADAYGRSLTLREQQIVGTEKTPTPQSRAHVVVPPSADAAGMDTYLHQWRSAEVSVVSYLNDRGWSVEDVSQQNLGYDVVGRDPAGQPAFIEVKKVDGPDSRFSVTSNEMSFLQSRPEAYWFAMVVGQGSGTRLAMIRNTTGLPFERVCRRWDWECAEWARASTVL